MDILNESRDTSGHFLYFFHVKFMTNLEFDVETEFFLCDAAYSIIRIYHECEGRVEQDQTLLWTCIAGAHRQFVYSRYEKLK